MRRPSFVLTSQATETIFTGTRTQCRFFVVVAFVPVISSPKQTALVLAPFFYRDKFQNSFFSKF
jgi:hypothetical protein